MKFETMVADRLAKARAAALRHNWCAFHEAAGDYLVLFGSHKRPEKFFDLAINLPRLPGATFWRMLHRHWSSFDAIDHERFGFLMGVHAAAWRSEYLRIGDCWLYRDLPKKIPVFRGQDAKAPVGLAWSLDSEVAGTFARGHRGFYNDHPVVLCGYVNKRDVSGVYTDREESEVVVFSPETVEVVRVYPWICRREDDHVTDIEATVTILDARWPIRREPPRELAVVEHLRAAASGVKVAA